MLDDMKNGPGKEFYQKGKIWFRGNFKDDLRNGADCMVYYPDGELAYRGAFEGGKKEGLGVEYHQDCDGSEVLKFKGSFKLGVYHGLQCKLWDKNSNLLFDGEMESGKRKIGFGQEFFGKSAQVKFIGNY